MANNLGVAQGSIKVNTSDLKNADIALRGAGQSMLNFGTQAVAAFAYVVGKAAEFEKEMDFVQAVTQATGAEMDALKDKAIQLGKESVYGPVALSKAFVDLAKAGVPVKDIIDGVGEAAVQLATAADVPIPFAGENLANIMNTFKIGAQDAVHVADQLAGAANASAVELSDIVTTMKYAGPVAQGLGISIEEVNAALSILGKVGIKGSTAGTSLREIMLDLSGKTDKAKDSLKELGIITKDGTNRFYDASGQVKDLSEVFQILKDSMANLNPKDQVDVLNVLFGKRAIPAAIELMHGGADAFAAINEQITGTTAADVASKRMDNLDGSIKRLKATLEAVFVQAGGPFQQMLKGFVDGLRDLILWVDALPGPLKTFLLGAVAVIGILSIFAGAFLLTVGNIVRMIRVVREIGGLVQGLSGFFRAGAAANSAFSATFLANPIFLVVAAIVALIAIIVLLYFHVKPVREFFDRLWQSMQAAWDGILKGVQGLWQGMQKIWDQILGFTSRLGGTLKRAANGIVKGFKELPGQIAGFFNKIWDTVYGFFAGLASTAKNAFGTAASAVGGFFSTIGRFFSRLPGIVASAVSTAASAVSNAIKTAASAVGNFLAKLPGRIAYAIGYAIGFLIRATYEIGKVVIKTLIKVVQETIKFGIGFGKALISGIVTAVMKVYDFLTAMPGRVFGFFKLVITKVIQFGAMLIKEGIKLAIGFVETIISFVTQLPGRILSIMTSALNWVIGFIPQFTSAAWSIGTGIFQTIWDFVTRIPGIVFNALWTALQAVWNAVSGFVSAAWDLGSKTVGAILDFFISLPGKIVGLLWDAVQAVAGFVGDMFTAGKNLASNLWDGFKDGLGIHSPSFIERAMWDIEGNMTGSIGNLKADVRTLQNMGNRLPTLNAGMLGLPSSGDVAVNANGGGQIWQQNAPLIGSAVIRDDRDIGLLARELDAQKRRTDRARGLATV